MENLPNISRLFTDNKVEPKSDRQALLIAMQLTGFHTDLPPKGHPVTKYLESIERRLKAVGNVEVRL